MLFPKTLTAYSRAIALLLMLPLVQCVPPASAQSNAGNPVLRPPLSNSNSNAGVTAPTPVSSGAATPVPVPASTSADSDVSTAMPGTAAIPSSAAAPTYSAPPTTTNRVPQSADPQGIPSLKGKARSQFNIVGNQKQYTKNGINSDAIPNKPVQLPTPQAIVVPPPGQTRQYPKAASRPVEIPKEALAIGEPIFDENVILLKRPPIKALISVEDDLNPFGLDAQYSQPITLRDSLLTAVNCNLDLAISRSQEHTQKLTYLSSLGAFLPDVGISYQESENKGEVRLPFSNIANSNILGGSSSSTAAMSTENSKTTTFKINSPFVFSNANFRYYAYRGGKIVFGAIREKHNLNAAKSGLNATVSDTLQTVARDFYNLVLAEALLQIRIKAVDTSEEQVRVNTERFENGLATNLDVLQSRTQLSRDRQALVDQQVNRRASAITLADHLNQNLGGDLGPVTANVRKVRLVSPKVRVPELLRVALDHRPELKQYDELRQAAKASIITASAPLQPDVALNGNVYGIGPTLGQVEALYTIGFNANWKFGGLGTVDAANIAAARSNARTAALQQQKELVTVLDQVRTSYIRSLDAERNIEETTNEVSSSAEELRLAQLRFANGLGTNLDIITAQRDYTQALINKAQAIINFNIAQVNLVHDVGLASIDNYSSGRMIGP